MSTCPHIAPQFLQYITLPSLEHPEIADFDITIHDFISFLTRSTSPLASLCMVMPAADWQPHAVVEYFQPIPSLTDLELFYLNSDEEADDDSTPFRTFLEVLGAAENSSRISALSQCGRIFPTARTI
jgi:hypothetical protein